MINKAINRLKYTISNQNKPNATDAEALNEVLKYISEIQEVNIKSNLLFAKLFALYLTKKCEDMQSIDEAIKVSYLALKTPLEADIELLSNRIKINELLKYVNTLTIDVNEDDLKDVDYCIQSENTFWTVHQKAVLKKISDLWTKDHVTEHFYLTVNEFLKDKKLNA